MTPAITAVVVAYGEEPWLEAAVDALFDSTGVRLDVVVVDNGCTSVAVDHLKERPDVTVVKPAENLGYTGGCAVGAAEASGEYLVFVNSDAIVKPDALARLVAVAAEPGVGLAMGSIRLAEQPDTMNTAGNPLHFTGLVWAGGLGEPATAYAERRTVASGSGCCFAIRRELWQRVGGFPIEYFMYHEDTELSVRLWQQGFTVEYVPDAVVLHHYEFGRNEHKHYLIERNRLAMLFTTYRLRTLVVLGPALALTDLAMLVAGALGGWWRAKLRGYGWLWRNRRWLRDRRALVQAQRRVPDAEIAALLTARFDANNVEAPPGVGIYNVVMSAYWAVARRLI